MRIFLYAIILVASDVFYFSHGKAILLIDLVNYQNYDNVMHNGRKCENFHWAGDHCDPMFRVCVSTTYSCSLLNTFIDFWKNKKTVYFVMSKTIEINHVERPITVRVVVDDHDRYDEHDHIATFTASFMVDQLNYHYRSQMSVTPWNLNVQLQAHVLVKCMPNYYGKDCNVFCSPNWPVYICSPQTGQKICVVNCGRFGKCEITPQRQSSYCKCKLGWMGFKCQLKIQPKPTTQIACTSTYYPTSESTTTVTTTTQPMTKSSSAISTSTEATTETSTTTSTIIPPTTTNSNSEKSFSTTARSSSFISTTSLQSTTKNAPIVSKHNKPSKLSDSRTSTNVPSNIMPAGMLLQQHEIKALLDTARPENSHTPKIFYSLFVIIIVCLIVMLYFRNRQFKKFTKLFNTSATERPLPQVVYISDIRSQYPIPSYSEDKSDFYQSLEFDYDSCTIQKFPELEQKNLPIFKVDEVSLDEDMYEEPSVCTMQSYVI